MMRKFFVILILLWIFGFVVPLSAQETTFKAPACDLASLHNTINLFIGALGKLRTSNETDPVKIAEQIQTFANAANSLRATCDGLVFEGTTPKVLGPVTFPPGVYRAIASGTDNYMNVRISTARGECGAGSFSVYGFQLDFNSDGEMIFGSKGCVALLDIQTYSKDWTLKFERITGFDPQ